MTIHEEELPHVKEIIPQASTTPKLSQRELAKIIAQLTTDASALINSTEEAYLDVPSMNRTGARIHYSAERLLTLISDDPTEIR